MHAFLRQALVDRGARHVGRLRMRMPDPSTRMTLQTAVEDVLRLTTLPGEDQGRVYFFRRLRLPPIAGRASRDWAARAARHLQAAGADAVSAADARAAGAEAVFFHDVHEPRRLLLSRLAGGDAAREWFWPPATGVASELPAAIRIEQLLEYWHVQAAGWTGVARELLPSLDRTSARELLIRLRPSAAQRWIARLSGDSRRRLSEPVRVVIPRRHSADLLFRVRLHLDDTDPRLLFFAMLAVLETAPAAAGKSSLVERAAQLIAASSHSSAAEITGPNRDDRGRLVPTSSATTRGRSLAHDRDTGAASDDVAEAPLPTPELPTQSEHATAAAGLYFLIHALRHVGVVEALDTHPELVMTHFPARVLRRLAMQAGVDDSDPILQPLVDDIGDMTANAANDPVVMPSSLQHLARLHAAPDLTERLWALAVRRWCRAHTRGSLAAILTRPGRIFARPTSIDVTLPMSAVDVRIRRAGLDLDPGYVPWLARVVHFHYSAERGDGARQ